MPYRNVLITGGAGFIVSHLASALVERILNFAPKVTLREGLHAFVQWVQEQDIAASHYENSLREMREKKLLK